MKSPGKKLDWYETRVNKCSKDMSGLLPPTSIVTRASYRVNTDYI